MSCLLYTCIGSPGHPVGVSWLLNSCEFSLFPITEITWGSQQGTTKNSILLCSFRCLRFMSRKMWLQTNRAQTAMTVSAFLILIYFLNKYLYSTYHVIGTWQILTHLIFLNNPMQCILLLFPFYSWGSRNIESLRNWPKVTLQVSGTARIWTQTI